MSDKIANNKEIFEEKDIAKVFPSEKIDKIDSESNCLKHENGLPLVIEFG